MMDRYEAVIGLEVHCQLATRSKIFCGCPAGTTDGRSVSEIEPNSLICEVCCGLPGALPVLNRRAVEFAVRAGVAIGAEIRRKSVFARKQYFYPDLPKGYQISQFDQPLCEGGQIDIEIDRGGARRAIRIQRIHLEEDAGKSVHEYGSTLVNLNRTGVPLIEIVSEPELRSPQEAGNYLRELHALLTSLEVTDGNLQEGNFRCDANISIRRKGELKLGTRVEIKNVNSFRFVERALAFEIQRQIAILEAGKQVRQETRLYDPQRDQTTLMRVKEESEDYRYFPDPDLPPILLDGAWIEGVRAALPELPAARRERLVQEWGLSRYDAGVLTGSRELSVYFDSVIREIPGDFGDRALLARTAGHLVIGELSRLLNESGLEASDARVHPAQIAEISRRLVLGELSSSAGKKVLQVAFQTGEDVETIVAREGLKQDSNSASLLPLIEAVFAENPKAFEELRGGKDKVLGFLVGQVMRRSQGRGNPSLIQEMIRKLVENAK